MMRLRCFIHTAVPPSTIVHKVVEWFEPMARTGEGYRLVSFTIATMSSTVLG
jgi:hypothetical protein